MTGESTALVLGGGGVTGVAWEVGMLAGLAEAGVPIDRADLVVGTSAGSVVGAQVCSGVPLDELYQRQLAPVTGEIAAKLGLRVLARYAASAVGGDDRKARARLGRQALRARTVPEADRRAVIAGRLPSHDWPAHPRLLVTAVEATTGAAVTWDRDSGVPLVDAVAASCAVPLVWPPMTIDGKRYVDGGVRSAANVDYASGCSRVLVLAPTTASIRVSGRIGRQLATLGPRVRSAVFSPDAEARAAMGRNVLDPAFRAASARTGRRQAASVAQAAAALF
ncbi:patatin-like phospholipase family protein [Actinoplanes regularis]|nr:patatin-like phospholipase family protein [Actinoplanes regularis]